MRIFPVIVFACLANPWSAQALAQAWFVADLGSAQEVPPNASSATGFGRVTLNAAETVITVSVHYSGLSSNLSAGHIHAPAAIGVNGPVRFNLNPTTGATAGAVVNLSFAVTPAQVADLRNGLSYINLHTSNFPGGEIRGQLLSSTPQTALLSGAQEVPPNASAGTGAGAVSINAASTQVLATLSWSGLGGNAIAGHIHNASAGANGPIVFDLAPDPGTSGTVVDALFSITPAQVAALRSGQMYFNLHNAVFPNGAIRGQIAALDPVFSNGFE